MERMLRWYGDAYTMAACMLRYFNAAGADPDGEIGEDHDPETHLIPLILDAAIGRRPQIDVSALTIRRGMGRRYATTSM